MPLAEAMSTQRAIRRLRSDPVDDDVVLRCIELATHAPTGSNRQGWEFVVVRDPEVKHQLARLNRQAWSVYRRLGAKRARREESMGKIVDAVQWQADHFEEVPVVVFCPRCQERRALSSVQWFCCSECGTPASEIVQGKELEVTALEIR